MSRAKVATYENFTGIDRRRNLTTMNPKALWDAKNASLTRGGDIEPKPNAEKFLELDANSIGLYAMGGKLRAAAPAGNNIEDNTPVNFKYDLVSNLASGPVALDQYTKVLDVTSWGADSDGNPIPYLVLENKGGTIEHHYVDGQYFTRVQLPFTPGPSIEKLNSKIYAEAPFEGLVYFSSTVNGPRDWTAANDAGFVDVVNNAKGDTVLRGLTSFNSQLCVFFSDSVQFWQTDPDPTLINFVRSLQGPGTSQFGSVSPVIADIYYFSLGGFQSLSTQNTLGEVADNPFGDPIEALTKPFLQGYESRGFWSQSRSQYLNFFTDGSSTTVFVRTRSPLGGVEGWTYWEFDFNVDYVAELEGVIYLRSGSTVYKLVDTVAGDTLDNEMQVETAMTDAAAPRRLKKWKFIDFLQDGEIETLQYRVNPNDTTELFVGGYNITGNTAANGSIPISAISHSLGLELKTNKHLTFRSYTVEYLELSGAG